MECREVNRLLTEYLTGELDADTQEAVDLHRESCAACREEARELGQIWSALESVETPRPSQGARERFSAALAAYEAGRHSTRWSGWPLLAQAAAAILFLIGGILIGLEARPGTPATPDTAGGLDDLRAEVRQLRELVAESMLQQRSASQRLRGVSWAAGLGDPDSAVVASLLETLESDPNVNVRLAVVDVLGRFVTQTEVRSRILQTLPYQRSPLVQVSLIDLLVEARDARSIPVLEQILQNETLHPAVRDRALRGIAELG